MKYFLVTLITLLSISAFANPIFEYVQLNELICTEDGWQMELFTDFFTEQNLDNCIVSCNAGSSYFNPGISFSEGQYILVTEADLQSPLEFDQTNDCIYVSFDDLYLSSLNLGFFDNNIPPAQAGQSYTSHSYSTQSMETSYFFTLDNTPTMGMQNSSEGTNGTFEGYVHDAAGNPVANVEMSHSFLETNNFEIFTDDAGYFSSEIPARNYDLHVHLAYIASLDSLVSIFPEQTNYYEFCFENYVNIPNSEIAFPEIHYNLNSTPNPFYQNNDNQIELSFSLPINTPDLSLTIYNSKGQVVNTIELGNKDASEKWICTWDGKDNGNNVQASGIYFIKLSSQGKDLATSKLIFLK